MHAILLALAALLIAVLGWLVLPWRFEAAPVGGDGDPERGAYVLRMGGCVTCHTNGEDGPFLAGGRRLETPFGTFYTSNITPDPETGIGGWSAADFILALTEGVAPEGHPYYPAFPYTSYTRMTEQDLLDLKAYLDTVEPVSNRVPAHDLGLAASFRFPLRVWQALYLDEDGFRRRPDRDELWNRGAYLVNGPGHCSECHTPRNALGAPIERRFLAGVPAAGKAKGVPNITPHADGIAGWSKTDLTFMLQTGILPDGDVVGGEMGNVVDDATSHLQPADLEAIATYLLSVEPKPDAPAPPAAPDPGEAAAGSG